MRSRILAAVLGLPLVAAFTLTAVPSAVATSDTSVLVNVGSPATPFSQNKQNEPAVAIDPMHPNVVVAGANDNIDEEACNAGDDTTCPFTPGVSGSGVYFSFNGGASWTQPTYTGYSARGCLGVVGNADAPCTPNPSGPIGTLPKYFENGLVADGDPAVAFGPKPASNGTFSWSNGSRLYYANLTSANPTVASTLLKGAEGIAVSRTDDVATAASGGVAGKAAWMDPVIVSKQSSATFADKEQIWIDNASSSPFFGRAYICFARFQGAGAAPMVVATSMNGGTTWASKQVSPAHNVSPKHFGQSGCTIRTDSEGNAYVFYEEFTALAGPAGLPVGTHFIVTSTNGGVSWSRPEAIGPVTDPCFALQFDGTSPRCVNDGVAGARNDLAGAPSVSIANGAPTGAGATDELVLTWVDGRDGVNHEHVFVRYSTDKGTTWSAPTAVETTGDRGYYSAPALSPDGKDLYLVYNAFTTPFRSNTSDPRGLVGVVKHADIGAGGTPANWMEVNRGAVGDPRASSQNNQFLEFLGDYVYAAATNDYAVAVWNDTRNGADCPAVDAWRALAQTTRSIAGRPAPQQDCVPVGGKFFGNSDIFGWSGLDPTTP
jgi:hypothetical protein